ncbi:MAG: transposase [Balneola sp.]|nr:MAG: transposase [Balneola sp.]
MGRSRFKFHEEYYPYFITCSIVDGIMLFHDPQVASIIIEAMNYMQEQSSVRLYGFVIMPNHLHLIVESNDLSNKIRKFKSYTARQIIDSLTKRNRRILLSQIKKARVTKKVESDYQIWQEGSYPKQIDTEIKMTNYLKYIHYNPVKAGFVDSSEDWRYSSMRNYLGIESDYLNAIYKG